MFNNKLTMENTEMCFSNRALLYFVCHGKSSCHSLYKNYNSEETSFIRHIIVVANENTLIDILCEIYQRPSIPNIIFIFTNKSTCDMLSTLPCIGVSGSAVQNVTCFGVSIPLNSFEPENDCKFVNDAVTTAMYALNISDPKIIHSFTSSTKYSIGARVELNNELKKAIQNTRFIGETGYVEFSALGIRVANISVCSLKQNGCRYMLEYSLEIGHEDQIYFLNLSSFDIISFREEEIELHSAVYICMLTCAGSLVLLAFILIICNVKYRLNRTLKLTSPNITIAQLFGAIATLSVIPVLGLPETILSYQLSISLISIGFSLQYGAVIVKQWRVYAIFKSLQPKRKPIKDELLLILIVGLVSVDITILTTWWMLNPIKCHRVRNIPFYQKSTDSYVVKSFVMCTSELVWFWLGIIYFTKLMLMVSGVYLAYQTRHVSSPPLRDSRLIVTCCYAATLVGLLSLPILGTQSTERNVKCILISLMVVVLAGQATILLVLPKVIMVYQITASAKSKEECLRFDTSLKKSSQNSNRLLLCLCWPRDVSKTKPAYGETLLAGELVTLRNTLKEKEARIRELNDRLYFGTENFRAYIKNGNRRTYTTNSLCSKINERRATVGDVRFGKCNVQYVHNWQVSQVESDFEFCSEYCNAAFDNPETQSDNNSLVDSFKEAKVIENDSSLRNDRTDNCSPLESGIGTEDRYENDFRTLKILKETERRNESIFKTIYPSNQPNQSHCENRTDVIRTVSVSLLQNGNEGNKTTATVINESNTILQPSPVIERRNVSYAHRRLTKSPGLVYNIEGAQRNARNCNTDHDDRIDHSKYMQYI